MPLLYFMCVYTHVYTYGMYLGLLWFRNVYIYSTESLANIALYTIIMADHIFFFLSLVSSFSIVLFILQV